MRADIVPGARFPDYALPDQTGARRRLSELQGDDPVALVLARGGYCPKEHLQHVWMAAMGRQVRLGASWPFLSDEGRTVQRDLDIAEYTDPEHDPMGCRTRSCWRRG